MLSLSTISDIATDITYWQYHLIFQLPALVVILFLLRWRRVPIGRAAIISIASIAAIALITTTPWDNFAVYNKIWDFDWARTTPVEVNLFGIDWKLPLEEYAFFVFETILVGLLTLMFLPKRWNRGRKASR